MYNIYFKNMFFFSVQIICFKSTDYSIIIFTVSFANENNGVDNQKFNYNWFFFFSIRISLWAVKYIIITQRSK